MTKANIVFLWYNREDTGNHENHPKRHGMPYDRQTASTTYHPLNRQYNGYTPYADTPFKPHGAKQPKQEIFLDGHY